MTGLMKIVEPLRQYRNSLEEALETCTVELAKYFKSVLDTLANQGSGTMTSEIIHQKHISHVLGQTSWTA